MTARRSLGGLAAASALLVAAGALPAEAATDTYKNSLQTQGKWASSGTRTSAKNVAIVRNMLFTAQVSNGEFSASAAFAVTQTYARGSYATKCRWKNANYPYTKAKLECTIS